MIINNQRLSVVVTDKTISLRLGTFQTILSLFFGSPNSLCTSWARVSFGNTTSRADRAVAARSRATMGFSVPVGDCRAHDRLGLPRQDARPVARDRRREDPMRIPCRAAAEEQVVRLAV